MANPAEFKFENDLKMTLRVIYLKEAISIKVQMASDSGAIGEIIFWLKVLLPKFQNFEEV